MKTIKELEAEMGKNNWITHDSNIEINTLKDVVKLIDELTGNVEVDVLAELKARIEG